jgi:hypothetical protein
VLVLVLVLARGPGQGPVLHPVRVPARVPGLVQAPGNRQSSGRAREQEHRMATLMRLLGPCPQHRGR